MNGDYVNVFLLLYFRYYSKHSHYKRHYHTYPTPTNITTDDIELDFDSVDDKNQTTNSQTQLQPSTQPQQTRHHLNLKQLAIAIDENYFEYYYNKKTRLNSSNHDTDCVVDTFDNEDVFNKKYKLIKNQYINTKFIFKYEIQRDLFELLRIRLRDGFKLLKLCNKCSSLNHISIYLIRYFKQTCAFLYKITYNILNKKHLCIELWLVANYLNVKSNYQNTVLIQQISNFIINIQTIDIDCRLDMSVCYI